MLSNLQSKAVALVTDNASAILTAGGVIGTVATAVLTARATFKAAELINDAETKRFEENPQDFELTKQDKVKLVAVQYAPPVLLGSATIAAIIMSNRISASRAAALAAAYGISQKQLEEYRQKLEQKLGVKKYEDARAEIQQERVDAKPVSSQQVYIIGSGSVLCYDGYSDRYFKSSVENIRKAENVVHREIMLGNECSLQTFYDELEIPPTKISKDVGWNLNHPCNVVIDTVLSDDKEPCIAIEFVELPIWNYDNDIRERFR